MSETTRDRILDAAERLLARLGYRKTTMDDLAVEAGLSKRTIYLHFPSKEEAMLSTIDRIVDRLLARLGDAARAGVDAGARIRRMLLLRVLFRFDSVRGYYASIDDLFREIRPAYMARRARYFEREAAAFAAVLDEGRRTGALVLGDPLETAHTLLLATNALLPSSLSTRELGARTEVESRAARVADLLLDGLRPRAPAPRRPASSTRACYEL
jgi:AcrR family transcriptional regulator